MLKSPQIYIEPFIQLNILSMHSMKSAILLLGFLYKQPTIISVFKSNFTVMHLKTFSSSSSRKVQLQKSEDKCTALVADM